MIASDWRERRAAAVLREQAAIRAEAERLKVFPGLTEYVAELIRERDKARAECAAAMGQVHRLMDAIHKERNGTFILRNAAQRSRHASPERNVVRNKPTGRNA